MLGHASSSHRRHRISNVAVDQPCYKGDRHFVLFGLYENFNAIEDHDPPPRKTLFILVRAFADDKGVKTSIRTSARPGRPSRVRSRYGYDHRWWGEPAPSAIEADDLYWSATRRPLPCLVFILPLLVIYEAGVIGLGGPASATWRAGSDTWIRTALTTLGVTDRLFLPLALAMILLGWQAFDSRRWRFHPGILAGMFVESLVLGIALIGLSKLVDLGFTRIEPPPSLAAGSAHPAAPLIGFLGAGLYEETLFRLMLIPLLYYTLRLFQMPVLVANTLAVTASALLFSLAHHAGSPGEAFTWYAFIFRWLAGIFFAWVFVVRGFGVAVGTHSAYDIYVGWLDWRF